MNALELADQLDFDAKTLNWKSFSDAANMLRQQQAEIDRAVELYTDKAIENEALKDENAKMKTKLIGHGLLKALDNFGKAQATCNGFCGDYECKENQGICKRKAQKK